MAETGYAEHDPFGQPCPGLPDTDRGASVPCLGWHPGAHADTGQRGMTQLAPGRNCVGLGRAWVVLCRAAYLAMARRPYPRSASSSGLCRCRRGLRAPPHYLSQFPAIAVGEVYRLLSTLSQPLSLEKQCPLRDVGRFGDAVMTSIRRRGSEIRWGGDEIYDTRPRSNWQ